MSGDEHARVRDFGLLCLRPELRDWLASQGLQAEVTVLRADGAALSSEALAELQRHVEAIDRAAQVARRLAILGELCAGVTHEARNLMTGVLGFTQIAIERANDITLISETLRPCEQAARNCVELLSNYLMLARGHARPPQLLSVDDVILPAARLVARQLETHKCTLDIVIPRPAPAVLGRRGELQQVVLNLVLNAAYVVGEGGTIRIEATRARPGRTEIAVHDNGPGVSAALRERIFQPLFTTKPEGEGTGLGLALSREIVEAHGGTLKLDPTVSRGARFVMELPGCPASSASPGEESPGRAGSSCGSS